MQEKQRIQYIDLAKGIGIIAVIIGHMGMWKLNKIIYSFHMPLFFLLAGAFISQKYGKKQYALKKAKQLLIPYVFICVILILLAVLECIVKGDFNNIVNTVLEWVAASLYGSGNLELYGISRIGAIWFLLAMFMSCVFVRGISEKKYASVWVALVVVVGYIITKWIWLPFSIQAAMVASGYVYIGYFAKQKKVLEKRFKWSIEILIFTLWILVIMFGQINMAKNLYEYGMFSFVGALCGVYVILILCKYFDEKNISTTISKVLTFYGKNSLIILCFHFIELEMFPWGYFQNILAGAGMTTWMILVLKFAVKMFIANFSVLIVRKIGFLRKMFSVQ